MVAVLTAALLAALLASCDAAGVTPPEIEPVQSGLTIGIASNLRSAPSPDRLAASARLRRAGFTMAREDFEWRRIEPLPGSFDWRAMDALVRETAAEGIGLLPLLNATPGWAGPSAERMPRDPEAYASFAARVVARYAPGGDFWRANQDLDARLAPRWFELYNEPYLQDGGGEPAAYARTVRAAVTRARRANGQARFLAAGETTVVGPDGEAGPWLEAIYEADPAFGEVFDALAVHPYSAGRPALEYTPGGDGARWQTRRVEEIRAILKRRGDGEKKLWITEIGWSTCIEGLECVSETDQAQYLVDLFGLVEGPWRSFIDAVFVYTLTDYYAVAGDKEGSFGLLGPRGGAKPAWRAIERLTRR